MEKNKEVEAVHKKFWQTSDFLSAVAVTVGFWFEINFPSSLHLPFNILIGMLLWATGLVLVFVTKKEFRKHNQKTSPGNTTDTLITSSIFKYSRNPTYVALTIIVIGFGVLFDSRWVVASSILAVLLMHSILVRPEEKFLSEKFGDDFKSYRKKVRPWI